MPAAAADGLTIIICNALGDLRTVTLDDEGSPVPSKSDKSSHERCAFAANVALAAPPLNFTSNLQMVEAGGVTLAAEGTLRPYVRAGPPLGSRAPPFNS